MTSSPGSHVMTDRGGVPVLTWPLVEALGVRAVVTTREGGVSEGPYASLNLGLHVGDDVANVLENRRRAAAALGLGLDDLVFCNQAHGSEVAAVDRAMAGRGARGVDDAIDGVDAMVTTDGGVGLAIMVADCVPILLVDPVRRALGGIHAGWRGTVADAVGATVARLAADGTDPSDVWAVVGPAIPPEAYQVGVEVHEAVLDAFGDAAGQVITPDDEGRWRLDLWTANEWLLRRAGIPADQIAVSRVPTGADGPFFSDRAVRPCGRFALLATLG